MCQRCSTQPHTGPMLSSKLFFACVILCLARRNQKEWNQIADALISFFGKRVSSSLSSSSSPFGRHPNSNRGSTNQDQSQGSILLQPRAAALPRLDVGSSGVKLTLSCIIQNLQTSCSSRYLVLPLLGTF